MLLRIPTPISDQDEGYVKLGTAVDTAPIPSKRPYGRFSRYFFRAVPRLYYVFLGTRHIKSNFVDAGLRTSTLPVVDDSPPYSERWRYQNHLHFLNGFGYFFFII